MTNQLTIQDQARLKVLIDDLSKWQEDVPEDKYFPKYRFPHNGCYDPGAAELDLRNGCSLETIFCSVDRLIDTFIRRGQNIWAERVARGKNDLSSKVKAVQSSINEGEDPEWNILDLQTSCIDLKGTLESILGLEEYAKQLSDETDSGVPKSAKRPAPKRAIRAANIEKIKKELEQRHRDARDKTKEDIAQNHPPELPPRPSKQDLAKQLGVAPSTVTRCFQDSLELRQLYSRLHDLDFVLHGQISQGSDRNAIANTTRSCPSCGESHHFTCGIEGCSQQSDNCCEDCHNEKVHGQIPPVE